MGARIDFTNHITILAEPFSKDSQTGYKDITPEYIDKIAGDDRIKWVQIIGEMPDEAYPVMDAIFERRSDLYFRIFNINAERPFDLSVLKLMPHLERVKIDASVKGNQEAVNVEELAALPNLKGLRLDLFDRLDYSFMKELSETLEELVLNIDTMSGGSNFSCEWLLRYPKLQSLWLGREAKKQLESVADLPELRSLTLRGIDVSDFSFLKKAELEGLTMLYCGKEALAGIGELVTLKMLALWRILKLENIDFIRSLKNLEELRLRDLNIKTLPDLSGLTNLKGIYLDGVPIKEELLDENIKNIVHRYR